MHRIAMRQNRDIGSTAYQGSVVGHPRKRHDLGFSIVAGDRGRGTHTVSTSPPKYEMLKNLHYTRMHKCGGRITGCRDRASRDKSCIHTRIDSVRRADRRVCRHVRCSHNRHNGCDTATCQSCQSTAPPRSRPHSRHCASATARCGYDDSAVQTLPSRARATQCSVTVHFAMRHKMPMSSTGCATKEAQAASETARLRGVCTNAGIECVVPSMAT